MLTTVLLAFVGAASATFTLSGADGSLATVYTSCKNEGEVALTFDDGPYKWIKNISDTVTAAGGNCTFFVNGLNWDCIYDPAQQDGLKYAYGMGHQIGSHTWSHADLTNVTDAQMDSEFTKNDLAITRILGATPAFMRPPYGSYNDAVREAAAQHGKTLIIWDLDSGDSTGSNVSTSKAVYDKGKMSPTGNILALNHETSATTVTDVLPYALQILAAYKYKFVTVAQCLNMDPYTSITEPGTPDYTWHC
ncbi:carbohydrate esterase family 4 protein [Mycena rosella]|uniref:Carbohydrate esterase family 4 protein n=1 Tax=Mycena rosella TaxID=1033263 RepID=A0AAD7G4B5_MYCRO|nr:carbohydrate esterase family 4 protein [Mycena rosella]